LVFYVARIPSTLAPIPFFPRADPLIFPRVLSHPCFRPPPKKAAVKAADSGSDTPPP
jgi:hypothetical protein